MYFLSSENKNLFKNLNNLFFYATYHLYFRLASLRNRYVLALFYVV